MEHCCMNLASAYKRRKNPPAVRNSIIYIYTICSNPVFVSGNPRFALVITTSTNTHTHTRTEFPIHLPSCHLNSRPHPPPPQSLDLASLILLLLLLIPSQSISVVRPILPVS